MNSKTKDLISGSLLLLAAMAIGWSALGITSRFPTSVDSGYFPERAAGLMAIFAVAILVRALTSRQGSAGIATPVSVARVTFTLAAIALYALAVPFLGFLLATAAFIVAGLYLLSPADERRWPAFVLTAIVATCVIGATFIYGFGVILPSRSF